MQALQNQLLQVNASYQNLMKTQQQATQPQQPTVKQIAQQLEIQSLGPRSHQVYQSVAQNQHQNGSELRNLVHNRQLQLPQQHLMQQQQQQQQQQPQAQKLEVQNQLASDEVQFLRQFQGPKSAAGTVQQMQQQEKQMRGPKHRRGRGRGQAGRGHKGKQAERNRRGQGNGGRDRG